MSIELFIAFIAVVISFFSVLVGYFSLKYNIIHNIKSVKPLGNITVGDFEDVQWVKIQNNGNGPLIIKTITVTNHKGEVKKELIDWMPSGIIWSTFKTNLEKRSILPNNELTLLKHNTDLNDVNSIKNREKIRKILMNLRVKLEYTDIYDSEFEPVERALTFFGRHYKKRGKLRE